MSDSVLSRGADIIWDEVDGQIVICDIARNAFFELNATAGLLWRAAEARTCGGIESYLQSIYPQIDAAIIATDVRNLVTDFLASGLLRRDDGARVPDGVITGSTAEPTA